MPLPGEDMDTNFFADLMASPVIDPAKYQLARKLVAAQNSDRRQVLIEAHVEASEINRILDLVDKVLPLLLAAAF